jgi:DNA topoisomerase I
MKMLIIESRNKIKKISSFLDKDWVVVATDGHFRDLPQKAYGISDNYELDYEFKPSISYKGKDGNMRKSTSGYERITAIRKQMSNVTSVYLATDPDREGEAIAWHIKEALALRNPLRIVFNEITQSAVLKAIESPRPIDMNLVSAQEARRALDRMVGWKISSLLRDKLGNVSAGRVQSPAVRIIVDREAQIDAFSRTLHYGANLSFGKWNADWNTKPHVSEDAPYILDRSLAQNASMVRELVITNYTKTVRRVAPPPPFTTSTLLQAASVILHYTPEQTTKLAQTLYEKGLVTYIRTDSVHLSDDFIASLRTYNQAEAGRFDLTPEPRPFVSRDGAQEAHEAIRPTHIQNLGENLQESEQALYRLIWQRAIASQTVDVEYNVTTVGLRSTAGNFAYIAKSQSILNIGWKIYSIAEKDNDEDTLDTSIIPELAVGDTVLAKSGTVLEKETKAPSRYTQASLIAKLEKEGIGRPSTYASILHAIIVQRGYLEEVKKRLVPTTLGKQLIQCLMVNKFSFINLDFTRKYESILDSIASGNATYLECVEPAALKLADEIAHSSLKQEQYPCPKCGEPMRRYFNKNNSQLTYWSCSNRDNCTCFMDDKDGKPVAKPVAPCLDCGADLARYPSKDFKTGKPNGKHYWKCSNRASCGSSFNDIDGKPVRSEPRVKHSCPVCKQEPFIRYPKKDKQGRPTKFFGWFCPACKAHREDNQGNPVL